MRHIVKSLLIVLGIVATIFLGRHFLTPDSWGKYGHYRADYIDEEANRSINYGENDSCLKCHSEVVDMLKHGEHKTLSCEVCHSPLSEHIADGKKIGSMKVPTGNEIDKTCLNCHQKNVAGRPHKFPMIDKNEHYKMLEIRADHNCNQCHTVHYPKENINKAKSLSRNLREAVDNEAK